MDFQRAIQEIELYLELFPISVNDNMIQLPKLGKYQQIFTHGIFAQEKRTQNSNDMRFVEDVLNHCSDDVLDLLTDKYGEESDLGQLIRKKRAKQKQRNLIIDEKQIMHDIKDIVEISDSKRDNPFYERVCQYIDKKGYKSDADFYNAIFMPRQLFARLRNPNASLSKKTVLWIIVGLKLSFDEAAELLSLAGYSFRKNVKQDIIVSYVLRNTTYDLFFVNEILDYFGCETFG